MSLVLQVYAQMGRSDHEKVTKGSTSPASFEAGKSERKLKRKEATDAKRG
jgi:hypothetical protein